MVLYQYVGRLEPETKRSIRAISSKDQQSTQSKGQ